MKIFVFLSLFVQIYIFAYKIVKAVSFFTAHYTQLRSERLQLVVSTKSPASLLYINLLTPHLLLVSVCTNKSLSYLSCVCHDSFDNMLYPGSAKRRRSESSRRESASRRDSSSPPRSDRKEEKPFLGPPGTDGSIQVGQGLGLGNLAAWKLFSQDIRF